jgi:hypothetical protein
VFKNLVRGLPLCDPVTGEAVPPPLRFEDLHIPRKGIRIDELDQSSDSFFMFEL